MAMRKNTLRSRAQVEIVENRWLLNSPDLTGIDVTTRYNIPENKTFVTLIVRFNNKGNRVDITTTDGENGKIKVIMKDRHGPIDLPIDLTDELIVDTDGGKDKIHLNQQATFRDGRHIQLQGGRNNDYLEVKNTGGAQVFAFGDNGNDSLVCKANPHADAPTNFKTKMFGGNGRDTLTGSNHPDYLDGGSGDDVVYGLGGRDSLIGNPGNDILEGGAGDDWFNPGSGNNTVIQ